MKTIQIFRLYNKSSTTPSKRAKCNGKTKSSEELSVVTCDPDL